MLDLQALEQRPRESTNRLFDSNKMKLGLFGQNCDFGCAMTTVDEAYRVTWAVTKAVAQKADAMGFEALVPVARWKGLGGPGNFNGRSFETYSWAAGLAEATQHITLVTTSHVQSVHPIMAAKQAATIDHISGGRYCLNVVCGWFAPEFEMFGTFMDHDDRYDYAQEWFDIVRRCWTETEEFDYNGKYLKVKGAYAKPSPIETPLPPVINAGGSERGQEFIARNADVGYVILTDHKNLEKTRVLIEKYRERAAGYGREIQIWAHGYVVQRETVEAAQDYLHYYAVEHGNDVAGDAAAHYLGVNSEIMPREAWEEFKLHLKAGYAGYGFVGTAETIAEQFQKLSDIGIDGVSLDAVDYLDMLERFDDGVLPLLEQAGLRDPFTPDSSEGPDVTQKPVAASS